MSNEESADIPILAEPVKAQPDTFFDHLPDFFENHQIQNWFRLTKGGVFVHEAATEPLVAAYQTWTKKNSPGGEGKSPEKCRKRLFGAGDHELVYALDGNRVLPGIVLPGEQADPQKSRIPKYQANLLPAKEYLHPKDPFLATLENPKSRMSTHEGFVLEYQAGNRRIEVTEGALRDFAAAQRGRPQPLRHALAPLARVLADAREIPPNQRMLVPEKLRARSNVRYFKSHGMFIALENDTRLAGCFSTKGKALGHFLRREIDAMAAAGVFDKPKEDPFEKLRAGPFDKLRADKRGGRRFDDKRGGGKGRGRPDRRDSRPAEPSAHPEQSNHIRGFAPGSPKKGCVGKTFSQGIAFHVHIRVLLQFLRQMPKVPKVIGKIPVQYSVRDLLERFGAIFRNTQPADERSLLGKLRRRESFAKYRRTGNWVFVVVDKNVLSSCVHLREEKAKTNPS